jgi:5-methylcytosine-specific restriction endonuclease McrBC regulatory subunit McrC
MQGSILFSENIRRNLAHRERLYVRHDVFTPNRAENRLIKTAAAVLLKLVDSHVNKQELKKIIIQLDEVELCDSVERDFAACINTRNAKKYTAVLNICRMVLQSNSSGYFGKYVENAVFFSMQELFEVYVSKLARAAREGKVVKALSKAGYLCRERKFFPLNPTISLYESDGSIYCVGNAKWQHITSANEINPDDIAKLYAAAEMTASDTAVMIFPSYGSIPDVELVFDFGRNVNLIIEFADFSEGSEVAEFICEVDEENEGVSEYEGYGEIEDGEFVAVVGKQMAEPMEFPVEEKEKIPEVTAESETTEIAKVPEKKRIKIVKRKR